MRRANTIDKQNLAHKIKKCIRQPHFIALPYTYLTQDHPAGAGNISDTSRIKTPAYISVLYWHLHFFYLRNQRYYNTRTKEKQYIMSTQGIFNSAYI